MVISTFKIKYPKSEFEIRCFAEQRLNGEIRVYGHEVYHIKSNTFVAGSHGNLGMVEYIEEGDYIVAYCQTPQVNETKEISITPLIKIEFLPFEV